MKKGGKADHAARKQSRAEIRGGRKIMTVVNPAAYSEKTSTNSNDRLLLKIKTVRSSDYQKPKDLPEVTVTRRTRGGTTTTESLHHTLKKDKKKKHSKHSKRDKERHDTLLRNVELGICDIIKASPTSDDSVIEVPKRKPGRPATLKRRGRSGGPSFLDLNKEKTVAPIIARFSNIAISDRPSTSSAVNEVVVKTEKDMNGSFENGNFVENPVSLVKRKRGRPKKFPESPGSGNYNALNIRQPEIRLMRLSDVKPKLEPQEFNSPDSTFSEDAQPPKRRRGRPRSASKVEHDKQETTMRNVPAKKNKKKEIKKVVAKKKPGRPMKNPFSIKTKELRETLRKKRKPLRPYKILQSNPEEMDELRKLADEELDSATRVVGPSPATVEAMKEVAKKELKIVLKAAQVKMAVIKPPRRRSSAAAIEMEEEEEKDELIASSNNVDVNSDETSRPMDEDKTDEPSALVNQDEKEDEAGPSTEVVGESDPLDAAERTESVIVQPEKPSDTVQEEEENRQSEEATMKEDEINEPENGKPSEHAEGSQEESADNEKHQDEAMDFSYPKDNFQSADEEPTLQLPQNSVETIESQET